MEKEIEQMRREEVIDELRKHAHHSWFHSLLSRNTNTLKKLLAYYREERKVKRIFGNEVHPRMVVGIDFGFCQGTTLHILKF